MLASDDSGNLGIQLGDVHDLAGVFLFDVGGDGDVVVVSGEVLVRHELRDVVDIDAGDQCVEDVLLVFGSEFVLVPEALELGRGIKKQHAVVGFGLLENDDAGGDGGAKKQVRRELDDCVDVVVVDEVLPDLCLCPASVEHARELDDRGSAIDSQPGQDVHREGEVGLRLRCEHTCGSETLIVDEQRVRVTVPPDRVRRVGHDRLERFVIPVLRVREGVTQGEAELLVVHVVQEHVDPCEVVGGEVDFLTEEATHVLLAEYLRELQQQRARACGRVVDLVHAGLASHGDLREHLGDLLRRVVLATGLACLGGVHLHEVLVGVTEQINRVVAKLPERQVTDRVQQFDKLLVAMGNSVTQFGTVDVEVVEEALEVVLAVRAHGRAFDVLEHPF